MAHAVARRIVLSALLASLAGCAAMPAGDGAMTFYDSAARMPQGCRSLGPVSVADSHLYFAPARYVHEGLGSNAVKRYGLLPDTILVLSSTLATVGTVNATGMAYRCNLGG